MAVCVAALAGAGLAPAVASAEQVLTPRDDPFYVAPENLASFDNGDVIRSRKVQLRTGTKIKLPYTAYQVLYRTTNRREQPIATVATIAKPLKRSANSKNLLSYQTAYDGLAHQCRPSYSLRSGTVGLQVAESLLINNALTRGWTVVTADYEGPNDEWGVAGTNANGVLDGIRAAQRFEPSGLTDGAATKVGMVGYSGGGQSTAWANEAASEYAPELNIVGAAQGGLTADLEVAQKALDGQVLAGIGIAGMVGISKGYPELEMQKDLNPLGKQVYRQLTTTAACITEFAMGFPFMRFRDLTKVRGLLLQDRYQKVAAENRLGRIIPKTPTFWYQTHFDQMGGSYVNRQVAKKYCQAGSPLTFTLAMDQEHVMQAFSHPLTAQDWLNQRFKGVPARNTCDKWG
jgi:hypothetical protein